MHNVDEKIDKRLTMHDTLLLTILLLLLFLHSFIVLLLHLLLLASLEHTHTHTITQITCILSRQRPATRHFFMPCHSLTSPSLSFFLVIAAWRMSERKRGEEGGREEVGWACCDGADTAEKTNKMLWKDDGNTRKRASDWERNGRDEGMLMKLRWKCRRED